MSFVNPGDDGSATASSGAATCNHNSCMITSESLSTATGSIYTLTLTNACILSTNSIVMASVALGTSTNGTPQIVSVAPAAGSVVVKVKNIDGTNAFNGTIKVAIAKV